MYMDKLKLEGRVAVVTGGGRGIGLAMVSQVVSRHGGTLEVTDSPLGGARFVVVVRSQAQAVSR